MNSNDPETEILDLIKKIDKDGNGKIDFNEVKLNKYIEVKFYKSSFWLLKIGKKC